MMENLDWLIDLLFFAPLCHHQIVSLQHKRDRAGSVCEYVDYSP